MKEAYLFVFALFVFGMFVSGSVMFATVGGPTYISQIAYKASDNSVYYIVHENGGRGCPPIIHKVNVATGVHAEVKSCDQLESENVHSDSGRQKYSQFTSDTFSGLPYLGSISFKENRIAVEVKFVREEFMEGFDEPVWREFAASVTQDGQEIGKINFRGCSKDQPHVFEGYMIPNSNKLAMLLSNKGDCFEGGYIKETLHLISGVTYYNTDVVRNIKTESATEPNTGNVTVYADTPAAQPENLTTSSESPSVENTQNNNLYYAIIALVVGLGIGALVAFKARK